MRLHDLVIFILVFNCCVSCSNHEQPGNQYGQEELESVLFSPDTSFLLPSVHARIDLVKACLLNELPVVLCTDKLNQAQERAQQIALADTIFTQFLRDPLSGTPFRNEIFGIYPARESDMAGIPKPYRLTSCYRVEMYNYALNNTSVAIVDVEQQVSLNRFYISQSQPDLPQSLIDLATQIAIASPEVCSALGYKPGEKDALMASTKTALNRTRCERSRHLCVAPTFIKGEKALWAIVDLTDYRLVGIRWTTVGKSGEPLPLVTERRLQDDKITACFCEQNQIVERSGWELKYMLTSSDGLRISDVRFKGTPILRNAKLVDWHVSYSGTDGFGYSDAVGCPYFSQAAVVAWEVPKVFDLKSAQGRNIGFVLEQTFRSEGWPTPCNYNYKQRYEFYNDGRFRISCASLGRGCGNTGTYRPVFRIAFEGAKNRFFEQKNGAWLQWQKEQWQLQGDSTGYTSEGYQYMLERATDGFYLQPGNGQFGDGGRGDFAYLYLTRFKPTKDEGESDLVTIGPCCNTDFRQGPEKFIEPESIQDAPFILWYVAQLRNDDRKGSEYCWAENEIKNGVYETKIYPCFAGPMFVPIKK
ncbi:MAG: hypothetical protein ACOVP6_10750 [Lacibacter sp.]